jgi:hypothetical protein
MNTSQINAACVYYKHISRFGREKQEPIYWPSSIWGEHNMYFVYFMVPMVCLSRRGNWQVNACIDYKPVDVCNAIVWKMPEGQFQALLDGGVCVRLYCGGSPSRWRLAGVQQGEAPRHTADHFLDPLACQPAHICL